MAFKSYHTVNGHIRGETGPSGRRDYLTDVLGSVTATVDQSAAVENTYRYKPYGERLAKTGSGTDPRFLWTGETGSRTTGVAGAGQYNRARHYARETGTWTTVDPLWPSESAYTYVGGNPVSLVDPSGLKVMILDCKKEYCNRGCGVSVDYNYHPIRDAVRSVCDRLKRCANRPQCKAKFINCVEKGLGGLGTGAYTGNATAMWQSLVGICFDPKNTVYVSCENVRGCGSANAITWPANQITAPGNTPVYSLCRVNMCKIISEDDCGCGCINGKIAKAKTEILSAGAMAAVTIGHEFAHCSGLGPDGGIYSYTGNSEAGDNIGLCIQDIN